MIQQYVPPTYPVLNFIARAGMKLAIALGVVTLVAGIWLAQVTQLWAIVPLAAIAAIVIAGVAARYVEVVRIVVDTLVPR